jgi:hypothetical protein
MKGNETMKKQKLATCTTLLMTDGTTSVYEVLVGPMGKRYFNDNKSTVVATYTLVRQAPDYRAMTARHATPQAPPVPWQAQ